MIPVSLSVPYILAAAAQSEPTRRVSVADRSVSCAELNSLTERAAYEPLASGDRPAHGVQFSSLSAFEDVIGALGAIRVGIIVTADGDTCAADDGLVPESEVAMTRVWSESPAAEVAGRVVTHGELLALAERGDDGHGCEWLRPLVDAISAILALRIDDADDRAG